MSDPPASESEPRRLTDDPLSVFLAVSAVILAVLYFMEEADVAELEGAAARAQAVNATLAMESCVAHSASARGKTLVVACEGRDAATVAAEVAQRAPSLDGFNAVTFAGTDGLLACGADPGQWPNGCTRSDKPEIKLLRRP